MTTERRRRVVIDSDPGVDDAAAILLAIARPEIELLAVTAVAGNVGLDKTTKNALRICEVAGADIPVAAGAARPLVRWSGEDAFASVHGDDGLGGQLSFEPSATVVDEHAIELIARLAEAEPLSLIAIAPLTDIALLLARYPGIEERIEQLVIMGGAREEGNASPAAEFNIWSDPEAAERVMTSGIPIVLIPLDVTHRAVLTEREVGELAGTGAIGSALAGMIRFYAAQHSAGYGAHFSPLHDVLATLYLTDPHALELVDAQISVDAGDSPSRGATLIMTRGGHAQPPNGKVAVALDRDAYARALIEAVRSLDLRGRHGG